MRMMWNFSGALLSLPTHSSHTSHWFDFPLMDSTISLTMALDSALTVRQRTTWKKTCCEILPGEKLILQLESFFFFPFPEAPGEMRVGVHYGAHIQLSEGGIAVNDINHVPTQRVVEAFEVLLGKCIGGTEKGMNYSSCQSQTHVHVGFPYIYLILLFISHWQTGSTLFPSCPFIAPVMRIV